MLNNYLDFQSLTISERIQLVEDILDSIATAEPEAISLSVLQLAEVSERLAEHDADPSTAIDWTDGRSEFMQRSH